MQFLSTCIQQALERPEENPLAPLPRTRCGASFNSPEGHKAGVLENALMLHESHPAPGEDPEPRAIKNQP